MSPTQTAGERSASEAAEAAGTDPPQLDPATQAYHSQSNAMCFTRSPVQTAPVLRVHSEIAGMFADEMDISTLSRWRATCRFNYIHASASLRRSLTSRIHAFVPYPQHLITIVTKYAAIFGGELALSFLLRTDPYRAASLEIFSSDYQFEHLCEAILDDPHLAPRIEKHTFQSHDSFQAHRRLVAQTLVIHLSNRKTIYVHQSYTCSASAPISLAVCTALSNYVTEYGFGCSHPELTLARRALLSDQELLYLSPHDDLSLSRLLAHNFSLAVSPTAWTEYRRDVQDGVLLSPEECWRERYICPNQGRFFGDIGSLVGYFNPLGGDEEHCSENNLAPFGPAVIWRLMSTFDCDDGCEYCCAVLQQGVTSVPVLFYKDPSGELRERVSDRCMRISPY